MLKVDMYVKIVLTIAICLVVIAFRPVFRTPAEAYGEVIDVNIVRISGFLPEFASLYGKALPVEVIGTVPVEVDGWNVVEPIEVEEW